jgi:hypothetical protein
MIESIAMFLLLAGWANILGWVMVGAVVAVVAFALWLLWLFKWND